MWISSVGVPIGNDVSAEALAKEELGRESKEPQLELKLPRFKDFVESAQAKNYI